MSVCVPCLYKKALENSRLVFLRVKAKERAIEQKKEMAIIYDEEDKKYCIKVLQEAENEGSSIIEIITQFT